MTTAANVAVVASRIRVEEKLIFEALARRGRSTQHIDPRNWSIPLGRQTDGQLLAMIREISFHRARYAARLVECHGGTAVNSAEVVETCGDKMRTTLALVGMGLPTPETVLTLSTDAALAACDELGYPVVIKPVVGSWGRLVTLLRDHETAAIVLEHRQQLTNPLQHICYLQRYIAKPDRDIRVVVANDEPVAAMYRYSTSMRTNLAFGGTARPCPVDTEIGKLAVAAAQAVGGGALGVDLVEDLDGRLHVLEVNHAVEFRGLHETTGVDVADAIVTHALRAGGGS